MVVDFGSLVAVDDIIRIRLAMECNDSCVLRQLGFENQVEWKHRTAVALEAAHPRGGPEFQARADAVSEVGLGWAECRQCPVLFPVKLLPDEGAVVQVKAEDGGVPNHGIRAEPFFMCGYPVVNDRDFIRSPVAEKIVQRAGDDYVKIEKERHAFDGKIRSEKAEFSPPGNHFIRRKVDFRNGVNLD